MESLRQPLSTIDIIRACKNHPKLRNIHIGTFPIDLLPKTPVNRFPSHLCFNHGDSSTPGFHWSSLLIEDGSIEICDSTGREPQDKRLFKYLDLYKNARIWFNRVPLQDERSFTCGFFVLSHAHFRTRGVTRERWLQMFSRTNLLKNDDIVLCHFLTYFTATNTFIPGSDVSMWRRQTCRAPIAFPAHARRRGGHGSKWKRRNSARMRARARGRIDSRV